MKLFTIVAVALFASCAAQAQIVVQSPGDDVADDYPAIQAALDAACVWENHPGSWGVWTGGRKVILPRPAKRYRLSAPLTIYGWCSVTVEGEHLSTLYWPTASTGIEIRYGVMATLKNLRLQGNRQMGTAIRITETGAPMPALAYMLTLDHMMYYDWGGIAIVVDPSVNGAIGLRITNSQFFTDGSGVQINGPTDLLEIRKNQFTTRTGKCVGINGGIGAASVLIVHNNMYCPGGAVTIDGNAGIVTIRDNEYELPPGLPVNLGVYSAAFYVGHALRVTMQDNTCNVFNRANYCYWVSDQLYSGTFSNNTSSGSMWFSGWRLPAGNPRIYFAGDNILL